MFWAFFSWKKKRAGIFCGDANPFVSNSHLRDLHLPLLLEASQNIFQSFPYHACMVYLPTFTIKINHSCREIHQSHAWYGILICPPNIATTKKIYRTYWGKTHTHQGNTIAPNKINKLTSINQRLLLWFHIYCHIHQQKKHINSQLFNNLPTHRLIIPIHSRVWEVTFSWKWLLGPLGASVLLVYSRNA